MQKQKVQKIKEKAVQQLIHEDIENKKLEARMNEIIHKFKNQIDKADVEINPNDLELFNQYGSFQNQEEIHVENEDLNKTFRNVVLF